MILCTHGDKKTIDHHAKSTSFRMSLLLLLNCHLYNCKNTKCHLRGVAQSLISLTTKLMQGETRFASL